MLESIEKIKSGVRESLGFEPLREVSFNSKKGAYLELHHSLGGKQKNEFLVTFAEKDKVQETSLYHRLKTAFEAKSPIREMLNAKWPNGIPAGKALALEGSGDFYVDVISPEGKRVYDVGAWALSQMVTIEPRRWGYSFTSLIGQEYSIKDSHIKLAISATPEDEGLMGVCLRAMRIAVVDARLLKDANILSTLASGKIEFFNKEKLNDTNFDYNLRWITHRLDKQQNNKGNTIRVLSMPEHNCIACFNSVINSGKEIIMGSLELQPASTMRMYKLFPASVKKLIDERWAGHERQLVFGQVCVTPFAGDDYIARLHGYYPSAEEVMAVLGSRKFEDIYEFFYRDETFEFSEEECKLAVMITPRKQGMIGICANIAQLCYLKNNYAEGYRMFFSNVMQMAESGYVKGIDNFIKNAVEHVKKANGIDSDTMVLNGIYSEIQAVYSEYLGLVRRNRSMMKDPRAEFKKMYMHISERMYGSEVDIRLYIKDRNGEEIPVKLIEVKNTSSTFMKKLYSKSGCKQFTAYLRECEKHTSGCGDYCSFDVYITNTDKALLNRRIFKRGFLEKLMEESPFESPRLKGLIERKQADGTPYERFKLKEVLYLALNELYDMRSLLTDKEFPIRLWLWSNEDGRFVRFNCECANPVNNHNTSTTSKELVESNQNTI